MSGLKYSQRAREPAGPLPSRYLALVVVLACGPVSIQWLPAGEDTVKELPPEDVRLEALEDGQPVRFDCKYMGIVQEELQVFGLPLKFVLAEEGLASEFLRLRPAVDNVRLEGYLEQGPAGGTRGEERSVFRVLEVSPAPTDVQLYYQRLQTLVKNPATKGEQLLRLGERIFEINRSFPDPRLEAILRDAVASAHTRLLGDIDTTSAEAHLALLDRVYDRVPLEDYFAGRLADLGARFPGHPALRERLIERGYRELEGRWLTEEEFRAQEGFVYAEGEWIKAEAHEFSRVLRALERENLTNLILRHRTTREYEQLARTGKVVSGMLRREVANAIGFADRVRRRKFRSLEIDQWDYGDRRIYLINGEVFLVWDTDAAPRSDRELRETVRSILSGERPPGEKVPQDG